MLSPSCSFSLFVMAALVAACSSGQSPDPGTTQADAASDALPTSDLGGDAPIVDADATPGGCQGDSDCKAQGGGVCNPKTKVCVPCLVSSDCPNALDICIQQTCVAQTACQSDKQCSDFGFVCDVSVGYCVQCLVNTDCTNGQSCKAKTCLDPGGPCITSKDCPSGQVCDKAAASCVGCLNDLDCDGLAHCTETLCKPDVCESGVITCIDSGSRKVCAPNGAAWSTEACATGTTCLEGACVAIICSPGDKVCAESQNAVATCNATGTAWGVPAACPSSSACKDAACQAHVCSPSETKCNAQGGMDVCADDGLSEISWYCPASDDGKPQVCSTEVGSSPACTPQVCVPGAAYCSGKQAMQCDAVGLSAQVTADCNLPAPDGAAQLCLDGACAPAACTAGSKVCVDAATIATCKPGGIGYENTPCEVGSACEDGACGPLVCTPSLLNCEDGKATKCSAAGTKTTVIEDCAAKNKVCAQGVCLAKVCTGGTVQCQGGQVGTCKADGTAWALQACPLGETCSGGKCVAKVCESGLMACQGKQVAACNGGGTAWINVQDCGVDGQTCLDGKCVAASCTPGQVVCDGKALVQCNPAGTGWTPGDDCGATGKVCIEGKCVPPVCSPGAAKCESGKVLTCNAGATAWAAVDDCAATDKVCVEGKCLVCSPGTKQCDGGNVATCKADGSGWSAASCDDGNLCTVDGCMDGACVQTSSPDGASCAAGMACKTGWCVSTAADGMALIPSGKFMMGCVPGDTCSDAQLPQHEVQLDAFYLAVHEVTVEQYAACVKVGQCATPDTSGGCTWGKPGQQQHPVTCVTWAAADGYCKWAGGRLPTEAEWERAARGGLEGKKFPWGDEAPTCTPGQKNTAVHNNGSDGCGKNATWAVGTGSLPNGYGLYDMAGNVWEWAADWFGPYPSEPQKNPKGPVGGLDQVFRGGSRASGGGALTASIRGSYPVSFYDAYVGFRCAKSIP
jgi:Cys-rich repeat protein